MAAILIAAATCAAMIAGVLFFPQVRIRSLRTESYWVIVLAGALLLLLTGLADVGTLWKAMTSDASINPLKILVLFLSMTVLSIFLDEVGFFRYLAGKALEKAGKSQGRLFTVLYLTVSVLTVFTSNDIIVLTFTPFLCYFAKNARISPVPYLVGEFVAANTMSMMLIIGNPTNIYIATSCGVGFAEYFLVMCLPTLAAALVAYLLLRLIFRKALAGPVCASPAPAKIENRAYLIVGLTVLLVCTAFLAVGPYFGLPMWAISLTAVAVLFAVILMLALVRRQRPRELKKTLKRAPWTLVPFVLSMFVLISALSEHGVTAALTGFLGQKHTDLSYGVTSFFAANLINNIPMSVLFCPVLEPLTGAAREGALYATVAGSNLGAYFTPIGALAGIMWMSMLRRHGVRFGFLNFVRAGACVSLPALCACLCVLHFIV